MVVQLKERIPCKGGATSRNDLNSVCLVTTSFLSFHCMCQWLAIAPFPLTELKVLCVQTKRVNMQVTISHIAPAGKMTLSEDVNLEEFVMAKDELSGADIKAVCTEAGLLALRERRMRVTQVRMKEVQLDCATSTRD